MLRKTLKYFIPFTILYILFTMIVATALLSVVLDTQSLAFKPVYNTPVNSTTYVAPVQTLELTMDEIFALYIPKANFHSIQIFISTEELIKKNVSIDNVLNNYFEYRRYEFNIGEEYIFRFIGLLHPGKYYITLLFNDPFDQEAITYPTPVQILYMNSNVIGLIAFLGAIYGILSTIFSIFVNIVIIVAIISLIQYFTENDSKHKRATPVVQESPPSSASQPLENIQSTSTNSPGQSLQPQQEPNFSPSSTQATRSETINPHLNPVETQESRKDDDLWLLSPRDVYEKMVSLPILELILYMASLLLFLLSLIQLNASEFIWAVVFALLGVLYHFFYIQKQQKLINYLKIINRPVSLRDAAKFLHLKTSSVLSIIVDINSKEPIIYFDPMTETLSYSPSKAQSVQATTTSNDISSNAQRPTNETQDTHNHVPEYKCPFCGAIISDPNAQFCSECGSSLVPVK